MQKAFDRKIVLEDGEVYYGCGFGAVCDRVVELVFNTSMVGYQEILSDPSYTDQAVVMTYPLIGNYGMTEEDYETAIPSLGGLIVREDNDAPSNWRYTNTLAQVMQRHHIPGIAEIDTRKLARFIRDKGSRRAYLTAADTPLERALAVLAQTPVPHDAVARVSSPELRRFVVPRAKYHVAAIDCGMKRNIVRSLNARGCNVTVLPWTTTADEVLALQPDGVFLSNGPGDPTDAKPVIELVRALRGKVPIFGICLGHQIIALAYGAKTYKLKFGHHGGNHPVRDLRTGKLEITPQNHSYAVDADSLAQTGLTVTHVDILDDTIEGVQCAADRVFSVQYHPESAPGPQDSGYLFDRFLTLMEEEKHA